MSVQTCAGAAVFLMCGAKYLTLTPVSRVVLMGDGALTTFDNTRVLAAQRAGISVRAIVRDAGDPFPTGRWTTRNGIQPATWGDAVQARIQQQNRVFRNAYPNGSPFTGSEQ